MPTAVRSVPPVRTVGRRQRRKTSVISPRTMRSSAAIRSSTRRPQSSFQGLLAKMANSGQSARGGMRSTAMIASAMSAA